MKDFIKKMNKRIENDDTRNNDELEIPAHRTLTRCSSATLYSVSSQDPEFYEYFSEQINENQIVKVSSRTKIKNFFTKLISRTKSADRLFRSLSSADSSSSSISDSMYNTCHFDYIPYYV